MSVSLMMTIPLLNEVVIIFVLSIAIFFVCHQLRLPALIGFLITGTLAGPHGFRLVGAVQEVEILAEIGVVLLLFTIGIEFSMQNLIQIKRAVLIGGSLQVALTIATVFLILLYRNGPSNRAVFIGFLISLSSTAIVLKLLQERGEMESPQGRMALAILIFQDIAVVPMLLFTPILAGAGGDVTRSLLMLVVKGFAVLIFVYVSAKWLVPQFLYQIARTRSRELFMLSIVAICFVIAFLTSSLGLSLALGAFLAGLIISESEYSHQALGYILPFRDVFTSLFFVSIGMLLDINPILAQPGRILLLVVAVIVIKAIIIAIAIGLLGYPLRTMIIGGLTLSQIAEFSFVLSKAGLNYQLIDQATYQTFLGVSITTMIASPLLIAIAPRLADKIMTLPLPERIKAGITRTDPPEQIAAEHLNDHLIIIGFGVNGRNVARSARVARIPYLVIEMNAETVKTEQQKDEPIYFGDASQETILEHANIAAARVLVIAISDPIATRKITAVAQQLNSSLHIIARTRLVQEVEPLYELGAAEVIPEEFETSIEIFTRVLAKYLIPRHQIEQFIAEVRADGYEMLRSISNPAPGFHDLKLELSDLEVSTLFVAEASPLAGRSLAQLQLRKKYRVSVLAIRRDGELIINPDGDAKIESRDKLIVIGHPENIAEVFDQEDFSLLPRDEKRNHEEHEVKKY